MPETTPEPCTPDPHGRDLRSDCTPDPCAVRTGPDADYETTTYQRGHVPGGDWGTTSSFVIDCTVPTTPPAPTPQLPNTGNTNALWLTIAGACSALLGLILIRAARR